LKIPGGASNRLSTAVSSNRKGKKSSGECSRVRHFGLFVSLCRCDVESKRGSIGSRMKHWQTSLAIIAALSASILTAEDFKTINGKEYKNATVTRVEADGIIVRTARGISKIYFVELPKDVADKWLAPILAAERAAEEKRIKEQQATEEKRIKEQQAAEEKRAAAERKRAETDKVADADLKQSLEQFQAAEQRATKAYESAAKGALSGQVFVSSRGGENFKLGAVQVGLFARDAIDTLLPAIKKNADYKIGQLRKEVAEAKAAEDQAEANQKLNFCYSGGFYFALLQSPIRTAETDADGKFVIEVPKAGAFVIAAQAKRSVGDDTEHYYWLQPVSLQG
jgi:hypothetical protein